MIDHLKMGPSAGYVEGCGWQLRGRNPRRLEMTVVYRGHSFNEM